MCTDCGCDKTAHAKHHHHHTHGEVIRMGASLLDKNDALAEQNRQHFSHNNITTVNIISSPGSGKTTLLSHTLPNLCQDHEVAIVVGDLETDIDAQRIRGKGASDVIQVTTGGTCHLDAGMVAAALDKLSNQPDVLLVENVGNLVCPASFDLGEASRVVLLSTTEGEDKPLKYPEIFAWADLVLITKVDLIPYLDFDIDHAKSHIRRVAPKAEIIEVSSKDGTNMPEWLNWLHQQIHSVNLAS